MRKLLIHARNTNVNIIILRAFVLREPIWPSRADHTWRSRVSVCRHAESPHGRSKPRQ